MSEAKVKPSLDATLVLSEEAVKKVSTRMFGTQKFLDGKKFEELCFADRLPFLKAELLECNETLEAEIMALQTREDLQAFIEREDVERTHNAVTSAVTGGNLFRIDAVEALSGHLTVNWSAAGTGFGQLYLYVGKDGKLHADSECMGRHFVRSVLLRMADELVIE
jgi:hypothetical protein